MKNHLEENFTSIMEEKEVTAGESDGDFKFTTKFVNLGHVESF